MATLAMDVGSAEQRARFPKHGWATNSQGYRLLWFPLKRLMENVRTLRQREGIETAMSRADEEERLPFVDTLRKHVIALRELHRVVRQACDCPVDFESMDSEPQEAPTARHHAWEISPLFADLALVYLRRLADRIAISTRPVLFGSYKSAPREYKKLVQKVELAELEKLDPICNVAGFQEAIRRHSGWFHALRGTCPGGKKGVRDAIEHRGVVMWPSMSQVGREQPTYEISLQTRAADVERMKDVLRFIAGCNTDMCALMSGLCRAAGWTGSYESRDVILVVGNDEDITAYWPEL